jgi:CelD/BcsL family acetyltransferase involved in cellulose biosynthesis
VIRDCIAEGARIYDFLGGDDPFKTKWGTTPTYCTHLSLARPTPGAYLYWWLPRFIKKIKTYARGKTPVGLLELKRSIQARLKKRRARP